MTDRQLVEFLVKLRDSYLMTADAANDYIETFAQPQATENKEKVPGEVFSVLIYEQKQGMRMGHFEIAFKSNNDPEKWNAAYDVLNKFNATIQNRYYGPQYAFSYWLYNNCIYRQQRKEQTKT